MAETQQARLGSGWQDKAIQSYRKSLESFPNPFAWLGLGVLLQSMNRRQEAIEALRHVQEFGDAELTLAAARLIAEIEAHSGGPCYVATACYGDSNHPDVATFRRLRDERLLPTTTGRALVALYYSIGPCLARHLEHAGPINRAVRRHVLEPLARRLRGR